MDRFFRTCHSSSVAPKRNATLGCWWDLVLHNSFHLVFSGMEPFTIHHMSLIFHLVCHELTFEFLDLYIVFFQTTQNFLQQHSCSSLEPTVIKILSRKQATFSIPCKIWSITAWKMDVAVETSTSFPLPLVCPVVFLWHLSEQMALGLLS